MPERLSWREPDVSMMTELRDVIDVVINRHHAVGLRETTSTCLVQGCEVLDGACSEGWWFLGFQHGVLQYHEH